MKVSKLQTGSELPSGEEHRSTEITSKPGVTEPQMRLVLSIYREKLL